MKIKNQKSKTKKVIILLTVIVVAALGYFSYAYAAQNAWPFQKEAEVQDTTQPAEDAPAAREEPATTPGEEDESTTKPDEKVDKAPVQSSPPDDGDTSTDTNTLSGVITSKSVQDGTLVIRTTINGILSGSCQLTLTRASDGKKVSRSAEIVQNPSSSSCKGFDVPTSQLGNGTWNISIKVKSGSKSGTLTERVML